MSGLSLIVLLLLSPVSWRTSGEPPGRGEYMRELTLEPRRTLLYTVRTGFAPGGSRTIEEIRLLAGEGGKTARIACWALMVLKESPADPSIPAAIEFRLPTELPDPERTIEDPSLRYSLLLRALHSIAWEEPDSLWEGLYRPVAEAWPRMPDSARALALEVFGKLGRADLVEALDSCPGNLPAHVRLRYLSEVGVERNFALGGELTPLGATYMARCVPLTDLEAYLKSPYWAVRYTVCERADPGLIQPLLSDPVAYVALQAALRRADAGYTDGREALAAIADSMPGPVGDRAASELSAGDSLLLAELLEHPRPGRRLAAQEAWLDAGLEVDSALARKWEADPYWLVPVVWVYHLESGGELGRARTTAERIAGRAESVDRPQRLLSFLEEIVTGGPAGAAETEEGAEPPAIPFDPDTMPRPSEITIRTEEGDLRVSLMWDVAPLTCSGFVHLAGRDFYDGIYFHRVVPGFVVQAGCPQSNGMGGPGYTLPNERSLVSYDRGVVGMADAGLNTAGSQFFVMLDSHGRLDTRYTAFGRLEEGWDVLDRISVGTRIIDVSI